MTDLRHLNSITMNIARREARVDTYAPPVKRAVDAHDPVAYDRDSRRVELLDLGGFDCRWPVNDPHRGGTVLFCGRPGRFRGYCEHHDRRAVGAGSAAERRAAKDLVLLGAK